MTVNAEHLCPFHAEWYLLYQYPKKRAITVLNRSKILKERYEMGIRRAQSRK